MINWISSTVCCSFVHVKWSTNSLSLIAVSVPWPNEPLMTPAWNVSPKLHFKTFRMCCARRSDFGSVWLSESLSNKMMFTGVFLNASMGVVRCRL